METNNIKLTDNEIVKALECCKSGSNAMCSMCPMWKVTVMPLCFSELSIFALDLINRQKAEIRDKDRHIKTLKDDLNLEKEDIGFKKSKIDELQHKIASCNSEIENYKQIAENQQSVSMNKEVEIKRLKAEVEGLQKYHDDMEDAIYSFREDHAKVKFFKNEIKAEAVKEFAERLKARKYQSSEWSHGGHPFVVEEDDIDEILEEMVGADK